MKGTQSMLGIAQDSALWAGPWVCDGIIKLVQVDNQLVIYQKYVRDRWESLDVANTMPPTKRHVKWLKVETTTLEQLQHERGEFSINQ